MSAPVSPDHLADFADEYARRLRAYRAVNDLVVKYRAISPSPSQQMYVRDLERALGMDLPAVTDRDGRTDW